MSVASVTVEIQNRLNAANGRRRERTIDFRDAVQAIREAVRDDDHYGYVMGGSVANSYGYQAYQTRVAAMAHDQVVLVHIDCASASKGTGTGLPWNRNAKPEKIASTIAEFAWAVPPKNFTWLRISRREAMALVSAQDRADAEQVMARIPTDLRDSDIPVTAADSLACGNCEKETARVQEWFAGRESVPASELLAVIAKRAPSLVSFAVRAIRYAASRQLQTA